MSKKKCNTGGYEYYRISRTINGKRRQFLGKTKEEAEKKYRQALKDAETPPVALRSFLDVSNEWLEAFFLRDTSLAITTRDTYVQAWRKHVPEALFASKKVKDVTALDLQNFYNTGIPHGTLRKIHNTMKRFYRFLLVYSVPDITPALVLPSLENNGSHGIEVLSDKEIQVVVNSFHLAQPGFRLEFMIRMALVTGCRVSEMLAISHADIDINALTVSINKQVQQTPAGIITTERLKTKKSRRILPLPGSLIEHYENHKKWQEKEGNKDSPYIFTTSSGLLYDKHNVNVSLHRYLNRIGLPEYSFHVFRRTYATNLCRAGVPLATASELLGHSNINTTKTYYINIDAKEKAKAAALMFQRLEETTKKEQPLT